MSLPTCCAPLRAEAVITVFFDRPGSGAGKGSHGWDLVRLVKVVVAVERKEDVEGSYVQNEAPGPPSGSTAWPGSASIYPMASAWPRVPSHPSFLWGFCCDSGRL